MFSGTHMAPSHLGQWMDHYLNPLYRKLSNTRRTKSPNLNFLVFVTNVVDNPLTIQAGGRLVEPAMWFTLNKWVQVQNPSIISSTKVNIDMFRLSEPWEKKANLRDLIAATGLVILLKLDSNNWFLSPCDLQIWWMTSKNNRAPLLYYVKLWASLQTHWWIQTWVTLQKCSIRVRISNFFSCVTLKFDGWHWKTIGNLF